MSTENLVTKSLSGIQLSSASNPDDFYIGKSPLSRSSAPHSSALRYLYARKAMHSHAIDLKRKLRDAHEELIGRNTYGWFVTLTFKNQGISEDNAYLALRKFVSIVNKRLYGKSDDKDRKLKMAVGMERNTSDGIHFHLLLSAEQPPGKIEFEALMPAYLILTWVKRISVAGFNNHARLAVPTDISYVTKELPKNPNNQIPDWL